MSVLEPDQLCQRCPLDHLDFETTSELDRVPGIIGQERAVEAIEFGIAIRKEGFNLFAMGPPGLGKHHVIDHYLSAQASAEDVPSDWCYVHNFEDSLNPVVLELPAGRGHELRTWMKELVEELETLVPTTFESEEYRARRRAIDVEFDSKQDEAFRTLRREAEEIGAQLVRSPDGVAAVPKSEVEDGPDVDDEDDPSDEEIDEIRSKLRKTMEKVPLWERERRKRIRALNEETMRSLTAEPFSEVEEQFSDLAEVKDYLEHVRDDVIEHGERFLPNDEEEEDGRPKMGVAHGDEAALKRYDVNVLVDRRDDEGAPVVYEDNPTLENLLGRIEYLSQFGMLQTNFSFIRPGSLHEANGGYLVVEARKLLMEPGAWEELKRTLYAKEIQVETSSQRMRMVRTLSLEPEPIPLNVKVILVGARRLFYQLSALDPDMEELFKVAADFETEMDRNDETVPIYAELVATLAEREELRSFDRTAVARVVEYSARAVGDSKKLSTNMRMISDLLREADFWADQAGSDEATAEHVDEAILREIRRNSRLRDRLREQVSRGTIRIETDGARDGQVNGLSVIQFGQSRFGRPNRISATVRVGSGEVVDIEREVNLGGPIHSKGILIMRGYLAARYARKYPLSLSASIVFEQSYSGVDGDSASVAEVCALLSALADIPLRQSFALTGAIDQYGNVQAIGGVNEKIEGFYELCDERGLTGEQGVIIPRSNVEHLMLRREVIDAVEEGDFAIHAVETVDEAITLLTGTPAGERDDDGEFPEGTVNRAVESRLREFAERYREFGVDR